MSVALLVGAGLVWLGLLFGAALLGERRPQLLQRHWGLIYSLSLAVYCTSWTFYGTVTQAARSGWWLPPTFVGTILLYVFGIGLLMKLVKLAQAHRATSLADFIATRLGKSSSLAAVITLIAVLGVLPYIALQLKAVAMSFGLLTRGNAVDAPAWQDSALYVALAMALFAILFGARSASATEHNRGLVLAMAVESLLKLAAMLALGVYVSTNFDISTPPTPAADGASGFPALIVLGVLAMFTLPHQFHVGVVECREQTHLRSARWLFPLYMLLIALPVLPIAAAGSAVLAPLGVPSDLYVLALPLSGGDSGFALLAFLGGLSAATGMVILSTLALSLMIGNHWLAPLLLRGSWGARAGRNLRGSVLLQRRLIILAVVLLAWIYSRAIAGSEALADIGALSFSALATLAPALGFAIWRPQTPPRAVLWGLLAGFALWCWVLLLPSLVEGFGAASVWLREGPFGIALLAPDSVLGLGEWSRTARALVLSLLGGSAVTWLLAQRGESRAQSSMRPTAGLDRRTLGEVAGRFLSEARLAALLPLGEDDSRVDLAAEARIESELATVLGAASARLLLDAARRAHGRDLDTVAAIVGEASDALRFNQRLLEAALENMAQGISVVDAELRLVAWNGVYQRLFGFSDAELQVGVPVAELVRHNLQRGLVGAVDIAREVDKRIAHMRAGTPYVTERRFPDGRIVEIRGNPMPGGGFVATFTDVTDFRRAEAALKQINETLEQRVAERTAEYRAARAEAERANQAKSRFLAAISHDLAQPLNAAHLFTHALQQRSSEPVLRDSLGQIDAALSSAETLLSGLLDVSRLDAGGLVPKIEDFALDPLLQGLASEFSLMAQDKGLRLRAARTRLWVRTDPNLLRRVLQNFLSNAVRYAQSGSVLLGARRRGGHIEIGVYDQGPGIAPEHQRLIFEEFRRLDRGGQGLGLGLSIAERIARLLELPLKLSSQPQRGTCFAVVALRAQPRAGTSESPPPAARPSLRARVLVVDNDPGVLAGMQALLSGWGCEVLALTDTSSIRVALLSAPPDLLLFDYHLDGDLTGIALRRRLGEAAALIPCAIITADHSEAVRAEVAEAGCWLLHKPLKPLALRSLMTRLLAS
ncbi:PAS-domain containing protein [uncultured Aquimonas sp.]|uniref:hybrid sensor histidine kinase/response regulator n=1 Tax=uncultured Aquimonas sp. TaxID=385483 RepID=UPI00086BF37C|nr:PAS-domain containing protein [uncultured Aquimonas sp.]ODU48420.1 MAG: histidine kinase [Xanthomonadaceae bacterium SCN 69-123]